MLTHCGTVSSPNMDTAHLLEHSLGWYTFGRMLPGGCCIGLNQDELVSSLLAFIHLMDRVCMKRKLIVFQQDSSCKAPWSIGTEERGYCAFNDGSDRTS